MTAESTETEHAQEGHHKHSKHIEMRAGGGSNSVYSLGMVGAWVYYFKRATTTEERVKAFLKGLVWPAFLVYDLMVFLKKE